MKIHQHIRLAVILLGLPFAILTNTTFAAEPPKTRIAILDAMEGNAEDIVDTLLKKNIMASRRHYYQLSSEMQQLHGLISMHSYDERVSRELLMAYSWMRVIDIEITDKSWVEAAVGANQLSGVIIQISHFPTLIHRDIAWLDYLGREIELLTMEDPKANANLLNVRKTTLENTWRRVRAKLIKNPKNKLLLIQGDDLVTGIEESKSSIKTITLAKKVLDFVDLLEEAK